jgi:threonine-phosphate decarboxylase
VVHYPEAEAGTLRERLARHWNVDRERILLGAGATELLFDWCRWAGPGTIAAPAFGEFHRAWPEAELCQIADAATWPEAGPVVLTRPANPTGALVAADVVRAYAAGRTDAVLVDESFLDFCEAEPLLRSARGNLFVLRSLTKFWALPGLRVGALVGDVEELVRGRPPWMVNSMAEAASLASLEDEPHFAGTQAFVRGEGEWLAGKLGSLPGMKVAPPVANYLYCETQRATDLVAFARERRILVRDCSEWPGLERAAVRVAVRPRWENEMLVRVCEEFLCG